VSLAWGRAERVLAVRLDNAGDVLMTTPALRALAQSRPGRRVTLLTSPAGAEAARLVPEVGEVIVYEAPWLKATPPRDSAQPDLEMTERLRRERFDAAVIFTVYSQNPLPSALLCYLAGIPLRLAHCRENPYQLLTDWIHETEPEDGVRHEVERQLDLVAHVGCTTADRRLSLAIPAEACVRASALLDRSGVDRTRPWAVLHPGATAPSRRYPSEQFAEVARGLRDAGWQLVLTGKPEEEPDAAEVRRAAEDAVSLVGRLDFAALAAVISMAPILVSNNTGPVHIAAAVGTPVVDLYALTNPQHTPWAVPNRVLFHAVPCAPCYRSVCPEGHHNCLRLVRPADVVAAALELAAETRLREPVGPGRRRA
jgi:lipopolysaccharide heptosyltransferase II